MIGTTSVMVHTICVTCKCHKHIDSLRPSDAYMRHLTNHHWLRQWPVACPAPSHYLNLWWITVNRTLGKKLKWNRNRDLHIIIQENEFQNVVREMAAILSRPQCIKHNTVTHKSFHGVSNIRSKGRWIELIFLGMLLFVYSYLSIYIYPYIYIRLFLTASARCSNIALLGKCDHNVPVWISTRHIFMGKLSYFWIAWNHCSTVYLMKRYILCIALIKWLCRTFTQYTIPPVQNVSSTNCRSADMYEIKCSFQWHLPGKCHWKEHLGSNWCEHDISVFAAIFAIGNLLPKLTISEWYPVERTFQNASNMMTSSNENISRVTGPLWVESTCNEVLKISKK